jgi:hypothetical protein
MNLLKRLLCGLVFLATMAQPLMGQGPVSGALRSLDPGAPVRVSTAGHRAEGRLGPVDDSTLTLNGKQGVSQFRVAAIDSLWRRGRHTGRGAIVGGVVGAGLFTGFLQLIVAITCDSDTQCHRDHNRAWAAGIVIGGSGGALLGAGVGSLFHRWVRIVP